MNTRLSRRDLFALTGLGATHCDPKGFPWMYRVCPAMSSATSTFGDDFDFEDLVALSPQIVFDSKEALRDKAAGGRNAADQSTKGDAQARFTMEQVIAWNPAVIITGTAGEAEQILADPAGVGPNGRRTGGGARRPSVYIESYVVSASPDEGEGGDL